MGLLALDPSYLLFHQQAQLQMMMVKLSLELWH
jgi:hypothetical protein